MTWLDLTWGGLGIKAFATAPFSGIESHCYLGDKRQYEHAPWGIYTGTTNVFERVLLYAYTDGPHVMEKTETCNLYPWKRLAVPRVWISRRDKALYVTHQVWTLILFIFAHHPSLRVWRRAGRHTVRRVRSRALIYSDKSAINRQ